MTTTGFFLDPTYPLAQAPVRHHGGDLGYDLFAAVDTFVPFLVPARSASTGRQAPPPADLDEGEIPF